MQKVLKYLILTLFFCGCNIDSHSEEDNVPRDASFKVYCVESSMADVSAWSIQFEGGEAVAQGEIFSLPDSSSDDVVPLSDQTPLNVGLPLGLEGSNGGFSLPYGTYLGARDSDGVEIYISISELDELNTDNSSKRWYKGSTLVNGVESTIVCYDAE